MNFPCSSRREEAQTENPNGVSEYSPGSDRRGQQGRGPTLGKRPQDNISLSPSEGERARERGFLHRSH